MEKSYPVIIAKDAEELKKVDEVLKEGGFDINRLLTTTGFNRFVEGKFITQLSTSSLYETFMFAIKNNNLIITARAFINDPTVIKEWKPVPIINYTGKITEYMRRKACAIAEIYPDVPFYTQADYQNIITLDYNEAKRVWDTLSRKRNDIIDLCPQCIIVKYTGDDKNICHSCNYGKIHGICSDKNINTTWGLIRIKFNNSAFSLKNICIEILNDMIK